VNKAFPGVFDLPDPTKPFNESIGDIVVPAMVFYFIWLVIYHLGYMLFVGRYLGNPWNKYDTLYFWAMQESDAFANFCGWDASTPATRARMIPILKFGLIHAFFVGLVTAITYLFWFSFWLHSFFALGLFVSVSRNGSLRYFEMMTTKNND